MERFFRLRPAASGPSLFSEEKAKGMGGNLLRRFGLRGWSCANRNLIPADAQPAGDTIGIGGNEEPSRQSKSLEVRRLR